MLAFLLIASVAAQGSGLDSTTTDPIDPFLGPPTQVPCHDGFGFCKLFANSSHGSGVLTGSNSRVYRRKQLYVSLGSSLVLREVSDALLPFTVHGTY